MKTRMLRHPLKACIASPLLAAFILNPKAPDKASPNEGNGRSPLCAVADFSAYLLVTLPIWPLVRRPQMARYVQYVLIRLGTDNVTTKTRCTCRVALIFLLKGHQKVKAEHHRMSQRRRFVEHEWEMPCLHCRS
jgi:hypothetical protein